jgi:hypothetical protein
MPIDASLLLDQAEQFIAAEEANLQEQYALLDEMTRKGEPTHWRERLIGAIEDTLRSYRHHRQIILGWMGCF